MTGNRKTDWGDAAASWLAARGEEMENRLSPLVEQNSYTDNPEGGRKVGAQLRDLFAIQGLEAQTRESRRFADHLLFRTQPDAANRGAIALVGHLDTVFPPGVFEGFRRDGDLLRGPGVLDMKGGLIVIAFALRSLAETGALADLPPLRVVIVSDEEVGSPEGQDVIAATVSGASVALVFEAGRKSDLIITRRKGTGGMTITAQGRAAHAGNAHQDGVNAVWALSEFVTRAQQLTDYDAGITVNVGQISGGQGKNTVPDQAEAKLDLRFVTKEDGERTVERLFACARDAEAVVKGSSLRMQGGIARRPLERTDESARLLAEYGACARAAGLGDGEAGLIGGGSDASTTSTLGIPSIDGLGPRGSGFHTKEELIERATLVPKAQALARFIAGRCVGEAS